MKILTHWLRSYLPVLDVDDAQLAEDLTLRGIAVEGVFELNDTAGDSDGALFDTDVTTNRVDAMNHYGIAREAAAIYNLPLHPLDTRLPEAVEAEQFPVRIEPGAEELCGRFTAQVIRSVRIAPSEGLIARYFRELGQKSISNAVDITNFVLMGMGQPTHAYDLDKLDGGIVVRRAWAGEQLRLLDGSTRTLVADDLVVADHSKALGLAGVMGGYDSMITAETKNILVEAAWFDPAAVRASSRRHLLHTDASHRFERGADFAAAPLGNALVTKHILAACGGRREGEKIDLVISAATERTSGRPAIELSVARAQRLLGTTLDSAGISAALIAQYLRALGCVLRPLSADLLQVTLPSWRLDLTREIDLIEEIARVYGYNRFANTLPSPGVTIAHASARAEQAVRTRLLALGFSETLSSTFASPAESAVFAPSVGPVELENPLNEEAANLRPSLVPGMVSMLAGNLNRDVSSARLFETGAIFAGAVLTGINPAEKEQAVAESPSLALGVFGPGETMTFHPADEAPFFELKGALESVLRLFALPDLELMQEAPAYLEAGRCASFRLHGVAGRALASFGQLASAEMSARKLRQPIFVAELDLAALLRFPLRQAMAGELSRFQAVERDFSFVFPEQTSWKTIAGAIEALTIDELRSLQPVELWRNPAKFPGVFSTLIRVTFQSPDHTLTEADLTAWWAAIIAALEALGGTIRDR